MKMNLAPSYFITGITFMITIILGGIAYGQPSWVTEGPSLAAHESDILMSIHLQPHENEFLVEQGYYQVGSFQLTANNS